MKPLTIHADEKLSLFQGLGIFFSTYSCCWLLLEPLDFFGLAPKFSSWAGFLGYASIFIFSLISVFFVSKIKKYCALSKVEFITFTIISSTESSEYKVKAPKHMPVAVFLQKFISHLSKGPAKNNIDFLNLYFSPVLQVKKNNRFTDVDPQLSILQAKIRNGSLCQIKAAAKSENNLIMYSLK